MNEEHIVPENGNVVKSSPPTAEDFDQTFASVAGEENEIDAYDLKGIMDQAFNPGEYSSEDERYCLVLQGIWGWWLRSIVIINAI